MYTHTCGVRCVLLTYLLTYTHTALLLHMPCHSIYRVPFRSAPRRALLTLLLSFSPGEMLSAFAAATVASNVASVQEDCGADSEAEPRP